MIIEKQRFNKESVESIGVARSGHFKFAKNADQIIFQMFTKNIYSNPIGSVVREITSNCFDAHVEAKVNDPVIVRLSREENQNYISFIDVGTGMSPNLITDVYGVYFETTKDQTNDAIGGYGVGGKSCLAYGDSFYLTTTYNGIKYTYLIFKGETSPDYDLLAEEPTNERNGTTVKICILDSDVYTFQKEIIKQLYYFENIIFEGFNSEITNDYKIFVGENFMFRGHQCQSYAHVCLGRVAYPIDFYALDISSDEYRFPIALRFNIGELNVTVSRESLDYSKDTKALIIEKLKLAKGELMGMFLNEIKKIKTLKEYIELRGSFGFIYFDKGNDVKINFSQYVSKKELKFNKYPSILIPEETTLSNLSFSIKTVGKVKTGRRSRHSNGWDGDVTDTKERTNIYLIGLDEKKKKRTQSYLRSIHETYYLLTPKFIDGDMPDTKTDSFHDIFSAVQNKKSGDTLSRVEMNEAIGLLQEFQSLYSSNFTKYDQIVVPADYTMGKKLDANVLKREISYRDVNLGRGSHYRNSLVLRTLADFKGTIIYGELDNMSRLLTAGSDLETLGYSIKNFKVIGLSKTNMGYMSMFKHAIHVEDVFKRFILKKRDQIIKYKTAQLFVNEFDSLSGLLKTKTFRSFDKKLNAHFTILEKEYYKVRNLSSKYISVSDEKLKIKTTDIKISNKSSFDYIKNQTEKNPLVKYLSISTYNDETKNPEILKLINLVYVK